MADFLTPTQVATAAGLVAAVRGLNAAAAAYFQAWGEFPRLGESVSRILLTPLDAIEQQQLQQIGVLVADEAPP
jgi:hypothetical protein